jgi:non-ribosomal peptide synthetase component F
MPIADPKKRAVAALAATQSWSYAETPWVDSRDGHITANGGGRAGRVVAHIPQSEDGEMIIELRDALRALLEAT